jgi:hypothetical protein
VADLFSAAGTRSGSLRKVVKYVALCQRVTQAAARPPAPPAAPVPDLGRASDDEELVEVSDTEELVEIFPGVYVSVDFPLQDYLDGDSELEEVVEDELEEVV